MITYCKRTVKNGDKEETCARLEGHTGKCTSYPVRVMDGERKRPLMSQCLWDGDAEQPECYEYQATLKLPLDVCVLGCDLGPPTNPNVDVGLQKEIERALTDPVASEKYPVKLSQPAATKTIEAMITRVANASVLLVHRNAADLGAALTAIAAAVRGNTLVYAVGGEYLPISDHPKVFIFPSPGELYSKLILLT